MKKFIFAAVVLVFVLSSCSKHEVSVNELVVATTDVSINLETQYEVNHKTSRMNSSARYSRGNAPVYVSGVVIKATYEEGIENILNGEFDFVNNGQSGDAITMNIPLGSNEFTVVSKPTYDAANTIYKNNIPLSTIDDKQSYYSARLVEKQGIYAVFNGSETKTITKTDNSVSLKMSTDNARYNVVLETSQNYDIDMTVSCMNDTFEVKDATSEKASAIVLNGKDLKGANDVVITLKVYAHGSDELLKTVKVLKNGKPYNTKAAANTTLVLNYNASGNLIVQESGISFSWMEMTDEGIVVDID